MLGPVRVIPRELPGRHLPDARPRAAEAGGAALGGRLAPASRPLRRAPRRGRPRSTDRERVLEESAGASDDRGRGAAGRQALRARLPRRSRCLRRTRRPARRRRRPDHRRLRRHRPRHGGALWRAPQREAGAARPLRAAVRATAGSAHLRGHGPIDATTRRIRAVQRLEALGAEVLVAAADVSNPEEMRAALDAATARFGSSTVCCTPRAWSRTAADRKPELGRGGPRPEGARHGCSRALPRRRTRLPRAVLVHQSRCSLRPVRSTTSRRTPPRRLCAQPRGEPCTVAIDWGIWNEVGWRRRALAARSGEIASSRCASQRACRALIRDRRCRGARRRVARRRTVDARRAPHEGARAIVPGTGYLEIARAAFCDATGEDRPRSHPRRRVPAAARGRRRRDAPRRDRAGTRRRGDGLRSPRRRLERPTRTSCTRAAASARCAQ